jgi:uncharacterized protein (TIGR03382 family)
MDLWSARTMARLSSLLLLLPGLAWAQAPIEPTQDCGLEPPGAIYVPLPEPRPSELVPWSASEPPLVRQELRDGERSGLSGLPQARVRTGALSGKTVYLSPGHGFYRDSGLKRWATQRGNTNDVVEDLISAETVDQYLLPMLVSAGARVVPVREPDLNGRMVIVNNGDASYSETGPAGLFSAATVPGWGPPPSPMANNVRPFDLGGSRIMMAASSATASAAWVPRIPADGNYYVYVSYSAAAARVADAHFVVKHPGGESHFRVDQRRHGGTWVMLGRFYFKAGQSVDKGSVVALNDSTTAGGSISLDAVRFGGGTGFIGDSVLAPLGQPRYLECARYHIQFNGAPASVFAPSGVNALGNERNDDVTARPRFAAWDHEAGEDAVYVAWHTNASTTGTILGTETYVYGPNPVDGTLNFTGVAGSDVLATALRAELDHDFKAALDPNWKTWKLRSANLGEVNPAHNPETPAVLLEIAYHDAAADAARLKEPDFRRIAARAILQGLIKYFATKDGKAVHLPPEPITAVAAHNMAGGVEVRWTAPATDSNDLGGQAATSYRVYQSEDGLSWDDGTEASGTTLTIPLPAGTLRFFRVAALNEGGESFPSDTVGARVGATPPVLIVNAFDRLDASMDRPEDLSRYSLGAPLRMLLETMNDGSSVRRHGAAVARHSVAFDSETNEAFAASLVSFTGYQLVDWFTGRGGVGGAAPTRAEQDALRAFVTGGGHLLFSGSNAASRLAAGDAADQAFLGEILRAAVGSGSSSLLVEGQPGEWLEAATGIELDDGTRGGLAVGIPDILTPASSTSVLRYNGAGPSAGVSSAPGGEVLFLSVPLEGFVSPLRREYVMGAFLARAGLLATAPPAPGADPSPPDPGPANQWSTATGQDVRPPDPVPPPPPEPPYVVDLLPQFYDKADTGCGCGAGAGGAFVPWLLLGAIGQLLRRRRETPRSER